MILLWTIVNFNTIAPFNASWQSYSILLVGGVCVCVWLWYSWFFVGVGGMVIRFYNVHWMNPNSAINAATIFPASEHSYLEIRKILELFWCAKLIIIFIMAQYNLVMVTTVQIRSKRKIKGKWEAIQERCKF